MIVDAKIAWRTEGASVNAYLCRLDETSKILIVSAPRVIVDKHPALWTAIKAAVDEWFVGRVRSIAPGSDPVAIALPAEPKGRPS